MLKIAFVGAGSAVFAKNILGDVMLTPSLSNAHLSLYDIDAERLADSKSMVDNLNARINDGRATVSAHLGPEQRKEALRDSTFVVNAIQVGRYRPSTVIDFDVPRKYGLRQTIGDTVGIGGIFRGLRTIPVVLDIAIDMDEVCPDALLMNYTNPMSIVTGAVQRSSGISAVGLCHSVQRCVPRLLERIGLEVDPNQVKWQIAGINHMAWLLEVSIDGADLYPEIKRTAFRMNDDALADAAEKHDDMVRFELMRHFGFYVTESSEHNAEYTPYWIKATHPDLVDRFNVPLDEYPRRCEEQIRKWDGLREELVGNTGLAHARTREYGSYIMNAMVTGEPIRVHGNVLNCGAIDNLPSDACVEVPCLVDGNGVQPVHVGALPSQCAALNRTNVNVHLLTIEAALTGSRDLVYQAAALDPHTAAELPLGQIRSLCDDLIAAHGDILGRLK